MKTHKTGIILLSIICFFPLACSTNESSLNQSPACEITQPSHNSTISFGNIVEIGANASDPDGQIVYVRFFIDNELRHVDYESPYGYTWDTSEDRYGVHVIRAEALDDDAYSEACTVTVTTIWSYHQPEQVDDGWETASLGSVGLDSTRLISLMNNLVCTENHLIHGIIIIKNNRLVFEEYFDGLTHPTWGEIPVTFDRNRMHVLSSVTKSITATLVGIAIKIGFISSVDEKVFDYYPELADLNIGLKQEITLRHLLTMSSGLGWDESSFPLTDLRNDLTKFINVALHSNDDLARFILEMEMTDSPGAVFNYGGGNYNLLGDIIHRASGIRLDDFANDYLFEPLGIQESCWFLLRSDFVYASGDLALHLRDLAKVGQLFLQNGVWNGEHIIPEEWITRSSTPVFLSSPFDWSVSYGHRGYSFGWWPSLESYGEGAFAASGWGGQTLAILPEHDMVIVITGGYYWHAPYLTYHQIIDQYILPSIQ